MMTSEGLCHHSNHRHTGSRPVGDVDSVAGSLAVLRNGESLLVEVPEAEFRIRLVTIGESFFLRFFGVFREDRPAGGTWWSEWQIDIPSEMDFDAIDDLIREQIEARRERFVCALTDLHGHADERVTR